MTAKGIAMETIVRQADEVNSWRPISALGKQTLTPLQGVGGFPMEPGWWLAGRINLSGLLPVGRTNL